MYIVQLNIYTSLETINVYYHELNWWLNNDNILGKFFYFFFVYFLYLVLYMHVWEDSDEDKDSEDIMENEKWELGQLVFKHTWGVGIYLSKPLPTTIYPSYFFICILIFTKLN